MADDFLTRLQKAQDIAAAQRQSVAQETRTAVENTGLFDPSSIEAPATEENIQRGGLYSLRRGTPPETPESVIGPEGTVRVPGTPEVLPKVDTLTFLQRAQEAKAKAEKPQLETPHTVTVGTRVKQYNQQTKQFDIDVGPAPEHRGTDEEVRLERMYRGILTDVDRQAAKKTNLKFGGAALQINPDGAVLIGSKGSQEALDYFDSLRDPLILDRLKKHPALMNVYGDLHQPMVSPPPPPPPPPVPPPQQTPTLWERFKSALPGPSAQAPQTFQDLPNPAQYKGRTITNTKTGQQMVSDGTKWVQKGQTK